MNQLLYLQNNAEHQEQTVRRYTVSAVFDPENRNLNGLTLFPVANGSDFRLPAYGCWRLRSQRITSGDPRTEILILSLDGASVFQKTGLLRASDYKLSSLFIACRQFP
ncbi:MAG: hypothetical protein IKW74_07350 [Thermoguttaceae bacterium]|nr:hypothetical protein [Thermoguttaceae bacterium]